MILEWMVNKGYLKLDYDQTIQDVKMKLLMYFLMIVSLGLAMVLLIVGVYYKSCRSADVYNKINGTSFTCTDFMFASEQINVQTQTIDLK